MQIQIPKADYESLTDEDKIALISLLASSEFLDKVTSLRRKLNIPEEGFGDELTNEYGLGPAPEIPAVFEIKKDGSLDTTYFQQRQEFIKEFRKKLSPEIRELLTNYKLENKWCCTLEGIILYNKFRLPEKYQLTFDDKNKKFMIIINELSSPNDLLSWIKSQWPYIKSLHRLKPKRRLLNKRLHLPQHNNLSEQIDIFKSKTTKDKTANAVAKEILEKQFQNNYSEDTLVSETKRVEEICANIESLINTQNNK
jgi:transcriptional regulator with PAS, ATPase and Fis domain